MVFNHSIEILSRPDLSNEHFAVASINLPGQCPINVISAYFQFRHETSIFTTRMINIIQKLSDRFIVGADVNAFSTRWFHPHTNFKGRIVNDMIDQLGLKVLYISDNDWTFSGYRGCSNIDITLCSSSLTAYTSN